jgi:hypothetical protein
MIFIPMIAGAALGALKSQEEQMQANAERRRQAETTRYSPWTGMHGQQVKDPSLIGNMATGAAAGATLGQAYGAGAAPSAVASSGAAVNGAGSGATQFALGAPASNASPYMLGASGEAAQAAGDLSKYSLMGKSAAPLMATQGGGTWGMMGAAANDPKDMLSLYRNLYAAQ